MTEEKSEAFGIVTLLSGSIIKPANSEVVSPAMVMSLVTDW